MSDRDELGAAMPHDPDASGRQLDWLQPRAAGQHVLDLGCGDGRVARAIGGDTARYVAVDCDPVAIERCQACCPGAETLVADMRGLPEGLGTFDLVICLGNTFCLLWEVDAAVMALKRWASLLGPAGMIVLDDLPGDHWPEVAQGNWVSGVSDDGESQLLWADDDAVLAIRHGDAVDLDSWCFREDDRRMRIWTSGALRLAATAAGLALTRIPEAGVLVMRPA